MLVEEEATNHFCIKRFSNFFHLLLALKFYAVKDFYSSAMSGSLHPMTGYRCIVVTHCPQFERVHGYGMYYFYV